MGPNGRALSLLLVQVLLIAFAVYVGVSDAAFPGASTVARTGIVVVAIAASFLAGEVSRLGTHFGALVSALQQGATKTTPRDDRAAIDVLVAALDSANAETRSMAHKNLVKISGQEFPADTARWKAWWTSVRETFERPA